VARKTQGVYKPEITEPWEISRSKIADWRECEACFWLEKVKGVKPPDGPAFLINSLTDTLLKREMDEFRGKKPHPFFEHCGYPHLIPLDHPDLDKWVDARNFGKTDQHYNTVHKPTNIRFGGGIDDMFVNAKTGELILLTIKALRFGRREIFAQNKHSIPNIANTTNGKWICMFGLGDNGVSTYPASHSFSTSMDKIAGKIT